VEIKRDLGSSGERNLSEGHCFLNLKKLLTRKKLGLTFFPKKGESPVFLVIFFKFSKFFE